MRRFVITGSSCSGRTSVFDYFRRTNGYYTLADVAYYLIELEGWRLNRRKLEERVALPIPSDASVACLLEAWELKRRTRLEEKAVFPWTDTERFLERAYRLQAEWEREIPSDVPVAVFDGSIVDCAAQYNFHEIPVPKGLADLVSGANYDAVFLFDTLPEKYWKSVEVDGHILNPYLQDKPIHDLLRKAYEEKGLNIIEVGVMSVAERGGFIKGFID